MAPAVSSCLRVQPSRTHGHCQRRVYRVVSSPSARAYSGYVCSGPILFSMRLCTDNLSESVRSSNMSLLRTVSRNKPSPRRI